MAEGMEAVTAAIREEGVSLRQQLAAQAPEQESPAVRDAKDAENAGRQEKQIDLLGQIAENVTGQQKKLDEMKDTGDSSLWGKFKKALLFGTIALAIPAIQGFLESGGWEKLKDGFVKLKKFLIDVYTYIEDKILPLLTIENFRAMGRAVLDFICYIGDKILPVIGTAYEFIKVQGKKLFEYLKSPQAKEDLCAAIEYMTGIVRGVISFGRAVYKSYKFVKDKYDRAVKFTSDIFLIVFNFLEGKDKDGKLFLPEWMVKPVGELIGPAFTSAKKFIITTYNNIKNSIICFFTDIYTSVRDSITSAISKTKKSIITTYNNIKNSVICFFTDTYDKVVEEINLKMLMIKKSIITAYNNIKNSVTGFFSDLFEKTVEKFKVGVGIVKSIKEKVSCIITGVKDYVFQFVNNVIKGIGEFFQKIVDFDVVGTIRKIASGAGELAQKAINFLFDEEGPEPVIPRTMLGRSRTDNSQYDDTGGPEESTAPRAQTPLEAAIARRALLDAAEEMGAYDRDLIGDSEIDKKVLEEGIKSGRIQKAMLQAIIDDKDLSKDDTAYMKKLLDKATTKGSLYVHDIRAIEKMDEVVKKINEAALSKIGGAAAPVVVNNVTNAPVDASSSSVTNAATMPISPPTNYVAIL